VKADHQGAIFRLSDRPAKTLPNMIQTIIFSYPVKIKISYLVTRLILLLYVNTDPSK
jgi:hypothetical protein